MRKNKGFSLVELVVSVALLAVILIPISKFFIDSFRYQAKSQTKSSVTRVSQHITENFKNKNYLGFDFSGIKIEFEDEKPVDEFVSGTDRLYEREIEYNGLNYNVKVELDENPIINDSIDMDIPENFDCVVEIGDDGSIEGVYNYSYGYNLGTMSVGENFTNRGRNYTAKNITLILDDILDETKKYSLLIKNSSGTKLNVGIVKNFNSELKIYVKGERIYFEDGALGDGRTAEMARFESAYISSDVDSEHKENRGELLLGATLTVTDLRDTTVRDIFDITFPIDYDYSKSI